MSRVATDLAPGTPLYVALEMLSAAGVRALGVALATRYFEDTTGASGWLDDPASTFAGFEGARQFTEKTDADEETVLKHVIVKYAPVRRHIESRQERQRQKEDEHRARNQDAGTAAADEAG